VGEKMKRTLTLSYRNLKVISWSMLSSSHKGFVLLRSVKYSCFIHSLNMCQKVILICFSEMQKSFHYMGLLKAVMRLSMTSLKGADAKDIASSVTAIANEKIKAEKEANAGKKKTG